MDDDDLGLDPKIARGLSGPNANEDAEPGVQRDAERHGVDSGAMGTGGLTFEPPSAPPGSDDDLAFAPDLDDDVMAQADALFRGLSGRPESNADEATAVAPNISRFDALDAAPGDALMDGTLVDATPTANPQLPPGLESIDAPLPRRHPTQGQYPRARDVIARLRAGDGATSPGDSLAPELTTETVETQPAPLPVSSLPSLPVDDDEAFASPPSDDGFDATEVSADIAPEPEPTEPVEEMNAFSIGASIMRPPPEVATPSTNELGTDDDKGRSQRQLESMVDTVVVGQNGDDAHGEIHLQFKDDVLRGLYVSLIREQDGFMAKFIVSDDTVRRQIDGEAATLVNRLRDRGMPVVGYRIEIRDGDESRAASAFDDDQFDGF